MIGRFTGHLNRIDPGRKEIFLVKWDQLNIFHDDGRKRISSWARGKKLFPLTTVKRTFLIIGYTKPFFRRGSKISLFMNRGYKNINAAPGNNACFFHISSQRTLNFFNAKLKNPEP